MFPQVQVIAYDALFFPKNIVLCSFFYHEANSKLLCIPHFTNILFATKDLLFPIFREDRIFYFLYIPAIVLLCGCFFNAQNREF